MEDSVQYLNMIVSMLFPRNACFCGHYKVLVLKMNKRLAGLERYEGE